MGKMKKASSTKRASTASNDSDDWTLLSAPHSSASSSTSSSPDPRVQLDEDSGSAQQQQDDSTTSAALVDILPHNQDDGLTEIDLNNDNTTSLPRTLLTNATTTTTTTTTDEEEEGSSMEVVPLAKVEAPLEPGFTAVDSSDESNLSDDEEEENPLPEDHQSNRRISFHDLGDFVEIERNLGETGTVVGVSDHQQQEQEQQHTQSNPSDTLSASSSLKRSHDSTEIARKKPRQEKKRKRKSEKRSAKKRSLLPNQVTPESTLTTIYEVIEDYFPTVYDACKTITFVLFVLLIITRVGKYLEDLDRKPPFTLSQLKEMKSLHNDLKECIERQSLPRYMDQHQTEHDLRNKSSINDNNNNNNNNSSNSTSKPYRGFVCYGQESEWRKRFLKLETEFNLDLKSTIERIKRNITVELFRYMTARFGMNFTYIFDQYDYIQSIEEKRERKQLHDTIKHLKAENLHLLRRLNQPAGDNHRKLVVDLELKNAQLQRKNEELKADLIDKAGPAYMRLSLELEHSERDTILLKQFYHQVAQDVSKSLKQFNLHAVDASQAIDDHETLNSQLALTQGYLKKLSEKISSVLLENESLKEELRQAYSTSILTKDTNLQVPTYHTETDNNDSAISSSNENPNALSADNCMRNLMESRRRSRELELELSRMQTGKCSNCNNVDLEKVNHDERQVNRSGDLFYQSDRSRDTKQLPDSSSSTAMDKRYRESLYSANEEIVDGLMTFLTKFNNHVESKNHHPIMESSDNAMLPPGTTTTSTTTAESTFKTNQKSLAGQSDDSEMKTIPNYIREEVRSPPQPAPPSDSPNFRFSDNVPILPGVNIGIPVSRLVNATASIVDSVSSYISNFADQLMDDGAHDQEVVDSATSTEPQVESAVPETETTFSGEPVPEEPESNIDWLRRLAQEGWFFMRARQRKHLRKQHVERKDPNGRHPADWDLKRAKMREKLREKMRKAWHYIESSYTPDMRIPHHKQHQQHYHRQHHNQPEVERSARCGKHNKGAARCTMDHKRSSRSDSRRDEL